MAQVMELLGDMPRQLAMSGKYSHEMFNRRGKSNAARSELRMQPSLTTQGSSDTSTVSDFGPSCRS